MVNSDNANTMIDFQNDSSTLLTQLQDNYTTLETAYNQTATTNPTRRSQLLDKMNSITNTMNKTQQTQIAAYDVAINNDIQATTNKALQDATLDVLDTQLDNAAYNTGIIQQSDVNKARMADININQSKEYDAQMELFKMMSFYLVIILFFGVLGKFVPVIANITKLLCVLITLLMIYHIYGKMVDMYHRSSTNYDEYNFSKPTYTTASGADSDSDDDDDDDTACASTSGGSKTAESFSSIKPYNSINKSLLSKSKF